MNRHAAPILAAILLLLPVLYVGSYLALVQPAGTIRLWAGTAEHYRYGGSLAASVYWPLEQADRKLRPGAWSARPAPIPY